MAISKSEEVIPQPPISLRNFSQLVQALEEGKLHTDLTAAYQDCVRDLNDALTMERKATATINVSIKLTADRGVIETSSSFAVKTPPRARARTMLHVAGGTHLSTRNPNQLDLPLRTVPNEAAPEIRVVSD